jgi:hypothetical protein
VADDGDCVREWSYSRDLNVRHRPLRTEAKGANLNNAFVTLLMASLMMAIAGMVIFTDAEAPSL